MLPIPALLFWVVLFGGPVVAYHVLSVRRERNVALLMSYLAAATARGYPLADAVAAYGLGLRGKFGRRLESAADHMRAGAPLSLALGSYHLLPRGTLSVIRSAEAAGSLHQVFAVLSRREHGRADRRTRLMGFAIYPLIMCFFLGLIALLMQTLIAPKFQEIAREFGHRLPLMFIAMPRIVGLSILGAILLAACMAAMALPSPSGPRSRQSWGVLDLLKWWIPLAHGIERYGAIRVFAQAFEIELAGGVPLREALQHACAVEVHRGVGARLEKLYWRVEDGRPLSEAALESGALPPRFARMLALGEQGGDLRPVLAEIARECDAAADRRAELIRGIAIPLVVFTVGMGVLSLVLGVHLTLLDTLYFVMQGG